MSPRGVGPSIPRAIMCSHRKAAPAEVPAIGTPAALRRRSRRATGVPPSMVESRSWSPPVRNTPVASPMAASVRRSSASRPLVEPQHRDRVHAHGAKQASGSPGRPRSRREAVGITATRASPPPASSTKRRRIAPSCRRSSAPPMGMMRPRRLLRRPWPDTRRDLLLCRSAALQALLIPATAGRRNGRGPLAVPLRPLSWWGCISRRDARAGDRGRRRHRRAVGGLGAAAAGHRAGRSRAGPIPNPARRLDDRHRLIRLAHSDGDGRGVIIHEAYAAWDRLWADLGRSHYVETGMLMTAREPTDWAVSCRAAFDRNGTPYQIWDRARARPGAAPIWRSSDRDWGLFTRQRGGALLADRIVADLAAARCATAGVHLRPTTRVAEIDPAEATSPLAGGERMAADAVDRRRRRLDRQAAARARAAPGAEARIVLYLEPPADLARGWAGAPCFLDLGGAGDLYLVPPMDGMGLKFGAGSTSVPADPDDRAPSARRARTSAGLPAALSARLDRYRVVDHRDLHVLLQRRTSASSRARWPAAGWPTPPAARARCSSSAPSWASGSRPRRPARSTAGTLHRWADGRDGHGLTPGRNAMRIETAPGRTRHRAAAVADAGRQLRRRGAHRQPAVPRPARGPTGRTARMHTGKVGQRSQRRGGLRARPPDRPAADRGDEGGAGRPRPGHADRQGAGHGQRRARASASSPR